MEERILWGSPLPPIRSGVSDYAVELLPELCKRSSVRVLLPPGHDLDERRDLPADVELVVADTAPDPGETQLIHLGNNPFHEWLLERLVESPTVVVLHDLVLHHLLVKSTVARGDSETFERLLTESYGRSGAALAEARRHGITSRLDPFLFPATDATVRGVSAVVVHSAWARQEVGSVLGNMPVAHVELCVADPGTVDRLSLRVGLQAEPDEVVVMHLGFLTPEKGGREIVAAVAAAARLDVAARLVLVGEGAGLDPLMKAASSLGIADRLTSTGWVDKDELMKLPAAADLGVVIRTPSAGETSAAALRFLACGTPVAVTGLHQFLELPETVAPRVCPGPSAAAELCRIIVDVAHQKSRGAWQPRRRAARQEYEQRHTPARAAEALVDFLGGLRPTA